MIRTGTDPGFTLSCGEVEQLRILLLAGHDLAPVLGEHLEHVLGLDDAATQCCVGGLLSRFRFRLFENILPVALAGLEHGV